MIQNVSCVGLIYFSVFMLLTAGKQAPEEHIVQHTLVHNSRELVEQRLATKDTGRNRSRYIKRGHNDNPCETPQRS